MYVSCPLSRPCRRAVPRCARLSAANTACPLLRQVVASLSISNCSGPTAHGGGWNDMCLLLNPGFSGMTKDQHRSQFNMWCAAFGLSWLFFFALVSLLLCRGRSRLARCLPHQVHSGRQPSHDGQPLGHRPVCHRDVEQPRGYCRQPRPCGLRCHSAWCVAARRRTEARPAALRGGLRGATVPR